MKKLLLIFALLVCALSLPCSAQILPPIMQGVPAAAGGWARVAGGNGQCTVTTGVSTTASCTFGSTPAAGELIVIGVTGQPSSGTASITAVDASGHAFTSTEASPIPAGCISSGTSGGAILYEVAPGGLASGAITITMASGFNNLVVAVGQRYTGGTGTLTQHNCLYSAANSTTCPGAGATITTSGSSLVVGMCSQGFPNTPASSITSTGAWSDITQMLAGGGGWDTFMQDQLNVGAATYQVQGNVNWNGAAYGIFIASFN